MNNFWLLLREYKRHLSDTEVPLQPSNLRQPKLVVERLVFAKEFDADAPEE